MSQEPTKAKEPKADAPDIQTNNMAVILKKDGSPFRNEKDAQISGTQQFGKGKYTVVPHGEGFALVSKDQIDSLPDADTAHAPKQMPVEQDGEKYFFVTFSDKSSVNQQNNVELHVNGETLICKRGVKTIIPARFRECAEHANHPVPRQLPGEPRKVVAHIQIFPFMLHGEASEAEYLALRADGTAKTGTTAQGM